MPWEYAWKEGCWRSVRLVLKYSWVTPWISSGPSRCASASYTSLPNWLISFCSRFHLIARPCLSRGLASWLIHRLRLLESYSYSNCMSTSVCGHEKVLYTSIYIERLPLLHKSQSLYYDRRLLDTLLVFCMPTVLHKSTVWLKVDINTQHIATLYAFLPSPLSKCVVIWATV